MAVIDPANLKWYLSGGATNSDPEQSYGGERSSTQAGSNLFDDVTGDEAAAGATEYRCVYFRNEDPNASGLISPKVWIDADAPGDDAIAIGLDPSGKNGTATQPENAYTAPSGVTFSSPTSKAAGLSLPTLNQNDHYAIWIRRTTPANAQPYAADGFTVKVEGDSIP